MTASDSDKRVREGYSAVEKPLSELLARILNQLSISAWLPAATVASVAVVYGSLATNQDDLGKAITTVGSIDFRSLILPIIGAIALLTVVTQAFEYEAIRMLQGDWGVGPIARNLARVSCARHRQRRDRLRRKMHRLQERSFLYARNRMLEQAVPRWVVAVLEADYYGREPTVSSGEDAEEARNVDWKQFAPASDLQTFPAFIDCLEEYPAENYRIRPTRLGNILVPAEGMRGMVLRVYGALPASLRSEHDAYRGRLDLYCSMVVVFLLSALAAGPVLFRGDWKPPLVAIAVTLSMALLSYRAAIASARGYVTVLAAIQEVTRLRD